MIDRITPLIQKLEAGQDLTADDIQRTLQLQALDVVKVGMELVEKNAVDNEARAVQIESEHLA